MATIETSSTDGGVYFPRARIFYGDATLNNPTKEPTTEIEWLLSFDVKYQKHSTVSSFLATFALFGDPNFSYEFWGNAMNMGIRIEIAFDEATIDGRKPFIPWTTLLTGIVTDVKLDVTRGTVTILGQESTATFNATHVIRSYTTPNVKDVLEEMITSKGFNAHVDDGLNRDFGIVRADEKAHQTMGIASREISMRDLIAKLKSDYGVEVWQSRDGQTVYAIINPDADNNWIVNAPVPEFLGGAARHAPSNFDRLMFEHNLTMSQPDSKPAVVAASVSTADKKGIAVKSPHDADAGPTAIKTMMNVDGRTPEDAQKIVDSRRIGYMMRELTLEWHTSNPQLVTFEPNDLVIVQGTNSFLDGPYGLDYIEYSVDTRSGFRCIFHGVSGRDDATAGGGGAVTGS